MNRRRSLILFSLVLAMLTVPAAASRDPEFAEAIRRTAGMVASSEVQTLANRHGLQVLNVTWEDTGRFKGSCVGPNISDVTLQVQQQDPHTQGYQLTCLPVIRFPNFSDRTGDIPLDRFFLLVGNEQGKDLRKVTLRQFLGDMRAYLSEPESWTGERTSLLAPRDTHALVSAQACFLPIPRQGKAEFNPVLFNYQSVAGDPAVLTILATREGTSVTVIDNQRDGFAAGRTWGQRLFFNQDGQRASLTGQRQSEFVSANRPDSSRPGSQTSAEAAGQEGLNMVLLIQVPLKQKQPERGGMMMDEACAAPTMNACKSQSSDMESAVIGHGKVEGPFTEIAGLDIERDERFPVRVTVQFYQATSNGVVSEKDMAGLAAQIEKVYSQADYVGSLVTGGETGRPTEYTGAPKVEPANWWSDFWKRHESNTGQTREETLEMLKGLLGVWWWRGLAG